MAKKNFETDTKASKVPSKKAKYIEWKEKTVRGVRVSVNDSFREDMKQNHLVLK